MRRLNTLYGILAITIFLIGALVINGTINEKMFCANSDATIAKARLIEAMSSNTDRSAVYIRNLNLAVKKNVKKALNASYNHFVQSGSQDFKNLQNNILTQDEQSIIDEIKIARKEYAEEIFLLRDNMNIKNKVGVANILTITLEPKYKKLMELYDKLLDYEYGYYAKSSNKANGRITAIRIAAILLTLFALFIEYVILKNRQKSGTQNLRN